MSIKEIAEKEKISAGYVGKVLKFRFLSPKIQKMILTGEHSEKLTSHNLRMMMSIDFAEQEKQLRL